MSTSRTRWLAWLVGVSVAVCVGVLPFLSRASRRHREAVEFARDELAAAVAPPLPKAPAESQRSDASDAAAEETRVELPREPGTVGPLGTHARIELVCGLSGAVGSAEEVRIQVLADSDAQGIDERAPRSTFATRNAQRVHVADVTELLFGMHPTPARLRVVAETPRCRTMRDVELALSPEELARPSLITLAASLHFDCPWFARAGSSRPVRQAQ